MRKYINLVPSRKLVLICPKGISFEQMDCLNQNLDTQTQIYLDGLLKRESKGLSDTYDEDLISLFPDYETLVLVKNPYWRVLQIYLWNFLYSAKPNIDEVKTFKKTLISIYKNRDENIKIDRINHELSCQSSDNYKNFFRVENFIDEMKNWFGIDLSENPKYFSNLISVSSNYHESMTSLSNFYDKESADIVYEIHKPIFEKFGYSYYSYLDFHSPTQRIHHLHGNIVNKFEL
jgi:hypothetical protein